MIIQKKKLKEFVLCKKNHSLMEVSEILYFSNKRHCIVTNDNLEPVGIISLSDIVYKGVISKRNLQDIKAKEIMTQNLELIKIESTPGELCSHIKSLKNHNLPVTEDDKIIGMIDIWSLWEDLQRYKTNTDILEDNNSLRKKNSSKKFRNLSDVEIY